MTDTVLLAPATGAGNSEEIVVEEGRPITVYLYPVGDLTADEHADLQRLAADGSWGDVYDSVFGGQVRLNSTVTSVTVQGAGTYRIAKDSSTNAIGVAAPNPDA